MTFISNLRLSVICSSNMNRSMEAHHFLAKKKFNVRSFGTGDKVKLPGTSIDKPNIYEFGMPYSEIYDDLNKKDKTFYTQNGLLHMLDRNRRLKLAPERFQNCEDKFDVIISCEERVYDQIIEYFESKGSSSVPVHIINIDVTDNHDEAVKGAFIICDLVTQLAKASDLDNEIDEILAEVEEETNKNFLHCIMFY